MAALRELRRNDDVVIERPDKGNGEVILNKKDYVTKMHIILGRKENFNVWEQWRIMTGRSSRRERCKRIFYVSAKLATSRRRSMCG